MDGGSNEMKCSSKSLKKKKKEESPGIGWWAG
jgi:hypothetical protein